MLKKAHSLHFGTEIHITYYLLYDCPAYSLSLRELTARSLFLFPTYSSKILFHYLEKNKCNAEGKANKEVCAIIMAVNEAYKVSDEKTRTSKSEYFGPTGVEITDVNKTPVDWNKDP